MVTETSQRVPRTASGVHIDPANLRWWREVRGLSRARLAAEVIRLGWDDPETGKPLSLKRDSIAKYEHPSEDPEYRRYPRPVTLAALCTVLRITPAHLMPGQQVPGLPPVERLGYAEQEFRAGLIEFAGTRSLPVLNSDDTDYCQDTINAYVKHLAGYPDTADEPELAG